MPSRRRLQIPSFGVSGMVLRSGPLRRRRITWLQFYCADIARYKRYRPSASLLNLLFTQQGLWALLHYRIASTLHNGGLPPVIKRLCLYGLGIWQKVVEMLTGISISHEAHIGPGFYIGHFGHIFIGKDARIGECCNISHGVTVGEFGSWRTTRDTVSWRPCRSRCQRRPCGQDLNWRRCRHCPKLACNLQCLQVERYDRCTGEML